MGLRAVAFAATVAVTAVATAAPVRMRYPEGPAHGFVAVTDQSGATIAHGEMLQWLERGAVASKLVLRFEDGSLYDEEVRFTQRPVFRVIAYRLDQEGPSFEETLHVTFDRRGKYRVRRRAAPDEDEEVAQGRTEVPDDVSNGLTSILLKNLPKGESAAVRVMAFLPEPRVLELQLTPEGHDSYWIGPVATKAVRFRIEPRVTGLTGVLATIAGKQPEPLWMWIAPPPAPVLVKFEGALYAGGPTWIVQPGTPTWRRR